MLWPCETEAQTSVAKRLVGESVGEMWLVARAGQPVAALATMREEPNIWRVEKFAVMPGRWFDERSNHAFSSGKSRLREVAGEFLVDLLQMGVRTVWLKPDGVLVTSALRLPVEDVGDGWCSLDLTRGDLPIWLKEAIFISVENE